MTIENQPRTPKKSQEVYVPPGRRSDSGTPNKVTSPKGRQSLEKSEDGIRNAEVPPNCCEDIEDGELEATPQKRSTEDWRSRSEGLNDTNPPKLKSIKVNPRKISAKKSTQNSEQKLAPVDRKESEQPTTTNQALSTSNRFTQSKKEYGESWRKPSAETPVGSKENSELEKFYANDVPYIDSHCHTDFMYTFFRNRSRDGLAQWVRKCQGGFPKSFAGLIANFIQPSLFVFTKDTETSYDLEWVAQELQTSDLYLGTTWGCHPHHAQKWGQVPNFWETLEAILVDKEKWKVLAVGECGIDLHRCETELEVQKTVFQRHVQLAFKYNLPLVIHCRNGAKGQSEDTCLEILTEQMKYNHRFLKIHRHCFTENWETAKKWLAACPDVHFGFTAGIFSFREPQLEAIRRIPLDRILLETDGPYFKPKSFDSVGPAKCCLPGMAIATAFKIAEIKGLPPSEVLRATYNNTRRVYQMPVF